MTRLLIAAMLWLAPLAALAEGPPVLVYFIGNSVTDTVRYGAFAELAATRGIELKWGRHMIPGAPLEWIHAHPGDGFTEEPYGYYPHAMDRFAWDAVCVQPFDRMLPKPGEAAPGNDLSMVVEFARLAAKNNSDVQLYLYARWPRMTSSGKAFDFDKHDYDPAKPGAGPDLAKVDAFADRWQAAYTGGWDLTNETQDYFDRLLVAVRKETPFLNKPPLLVPVGHVMARLDQRMRAGEVPGHRSIYEFYKDAIHLNEAGSYVVGCTFFATLLKQSPEGLPSEPYGKIDSKLAAVIQETAWEVVKQHPQAGVGEEATKP